MEVSTIISFVCLSITITGTRASADYFWRPFNGTIPSDAVPGVIRNGVQTYIGNAPYGSTLAIGELKPDIKKIIISTYPFIKDKKMTTIREHILILCHPSLNSMTWVETLISDVHKVPGLIQSGYQRVGDDDFKIAATFVGRAKVNGEYRLGNVVTHQVGSKEKDNRIYIVDNGKMIELESCEVLSTS